MKKKKLLTTLIVGTLACLASATLFTACGGGSSKGDSPSEGLAYALSNDGTYYTVTGWGSCTDTDIVIPSTHNDLPVTGIAASAFKNEEEITSVSIPSSITTIGSNAFNGCTNFRSVYITDVAAWCNINFKTNKANPLKEAKNLYVNKKLVEELVIPEGVTNISDYAFYGCTSFTSVKLPDSITDIGEDVFYSCTSLTSVQLSDNLTHIGEDVFDGCKSLQYTIKDGLKYLGSSTNDYLYLADTEYSATMGIIDSNCKILAKDAFYGHKQITQVTIPESITKIPARAFYACDSLASITLHENITEIPAYAFYGCSNLTSINIPDSVTALGTHAFYGCGITSIAIPNSVTTFGESAFSQCDNLTSITIPNGVTSIAPSLFYGCEGLTKVNLPNTIITIEESAFENCTQLENIIIPRSATSIGEKAFYDAGLVSIDIPINVTSIGEYAFHFDVLATPRPTIYCEAESKPDGWHSKWYAWADVKWGF